METNSIASNYLAASKKRVTFKPNAPHAVHFYLDFIV